MTTRNPSHEREKIEFLYDGEKDIIFESLLPKLCSVAKFTFYTVPKSVYGFCEAQSPKVVDFAKNHKKNLMRMGIGAIVGISSVIYFGDHNFSDSRNDVVNVLENKVDDTVYLSPVQRDGRVTPFIESDKGLLSLDEEYNSKRLSIRGKYEDLRESKDQKYKEIEMKAKKIVGERK